MMRIYEKYRGVLFLIVTNGTIIGEGTTDTIARPGNIFPVLSLEGSEDYGCSLSNNAEIFCDIASRTGASPTDTGNAGCKAYVKSGAGV